MIFQSFTLYALTKLLTPLEHLSFSRFNKEGLRHRIFCKKHSLLEFNEIYIFSVTFTFYLCQAILFLFVVMTKDFIWKFSFKNELIKSG